MKIFTIMLLLNMHGCVFLNYRTNLDEDVSKELPNLHRQNYGTIEYIDAYTGEKSRINTFWAQEASANPEARALIQAMHRENFPFVEPRIGIVDTGMHLEKTGHPRFTQQGNELIAANYENMIKPMMKDIVESSKEIADHRKINGVFSNSGGTALEHGTSVLGIIAGEAPAGMSSKGEVSLLNFDAYNFFVDEAQAFADAKKIPEIINLSVGFGEFVTEVVAGGGERIVPEKFVDKPHVNFVTKIEQVLDKTIVVKAVGNDFPHPIPDYIQALGDKMIVVGSADAGGFPSKFSQTSEKVVVLAPSDSFLQSVDTKGRLLKFGGTSGAAPMVSAVLADVKSILPDLNRDEVAYMLQKTATRTSINGVSNVNGAGVINHYKMLRVAKRLHEGGFAQNRALLYNDMVYDFTIEAINLHRDAQQLLRAGKDADDYAQAFKQLRLAFFLDSDNLETRKALAKIYRRAGHYATAELYDEPVKFSKNILRFSKHGHTSKMHKKITQRMQMSTQVFVYKEIENIVKWVDKHATATDPKEIINSFATLKSSVAAIPEDIADPELFDNARALVNIILHTQELVHDGKINDDMLRFVLEYTDATMPHLLENTDLIQYFNIGANKSILQRVISKLKANSKLLHTLRRIITI